ncbi:hypothetical protein [Kocuria tytonicola]|uniref:hypothetical protein n=1 Tax=Kocuria tytonicola TaxID=2055946 RepID=UPI001FB23FB2|nr:hypothetical protein [Kocuria tytonicola]
MRSRDGRSAERGGYGGRESRNGFDRGERSGRDERGGRRGSGDNRGGSGYTRGEDRRDERRDERRGQRHDGYRDSRPGRDDRSGARREGGGEGRWTERRREDRGASRDGRGGNERVGGGRDRQGYSSRGDDRREDGRGDRAGDRRDSRGGGYGTRGDRGGFGSGADRRDDRRGAGRPDRRGDRSDRPGQDRQGHGNRGGFRDERRNDRHERRPECGTYARDERRGGHDDARPRFVAPEIDADVTGRELDRSMHHELKALEQSNAERVAQHLVMAARYLEEDPEFALEHANAAVRKAGRIGVVREAAGVAAYAAGDFALALKELRTHRRISGSQEHLPLMVDSQRALGRADKAMEEATSEAAASLDAAGQAALAIVVSGIHADAGDHDAALAALEIPQLDKNRGFSYSPGLFRAYAEALRAVGRDDESMTWERQAIVAEAALGVGQFSEPEIVDLGDDLDEDEARRTVRDAQRRHSAPRPADEHRTGTDADDARPAGDDMQRAESQAAAGDEEPARDDDARRAGPEDAPERDDLGHEVPGGDDQERERTHEAAAAPGVRQGTLSYSADAATAPVGADDAATAGGNAGAGATGGGVGAAQDEKEGVGTASHDEAAAPGASDGAEDSPADREQGARE